MSKRPEARTWGRAMGLGLVAALSVPLGAAASWNQEYESANPVDSSGFLDVVATSRGDVFILGYHSGEFEQLDAGLQYQPMVQYRDTDGEVVWTRQIEIDETCTAVTPRGVEGGLVADDSVVFGFTTCSGNHLVTADTDGVGALRSIPFETGIADLEVPVNFDGSFRPVVDPTGGAHLVVEESRLVDGGSDDPYLFQFDSELQLAAATPLPTTQFASADRRYGDISMQVADDGVSLLIGYEPAVLAHLNGENFLVRVSADGESLTSVSTGPYDCGLTRVLRAALGEAWIIDCTTARDEFGSRETYEIRVIDVSDLSTLVVHDASPTFPFYGDLDFSSDGTVASRDGGFRYFRVNGSDPDLWTEVELRQEGPHSPRPVNGFDVIGADLIEVGSTGSADDYFGRSVDEWRQERLGDVPQAFIERTPLPSLAAAVPARLVDTRSVGDTVDGDDEGGGALPGASITEYQIGGRGGVPDDATAVFVNLTVVKPSANGFLTTFPCGTERPTASSLNFRRGENVGNNTLVALDGEGAMCVYASAATDLVIDVTGYFGSGNELGRIDPARLLDTRRNGSTIDGRGTGGGPPTPYTDIVVPVAGRAGVPDDASDVVLSISAITPQRNGFAVAYACGAAVPGVSVLNFGPGRIANNMVIAGIGDDGAVCLRTSAFTDLTIDVIGWLGETSTLDTDGQYRVLDTRTFVGPDVPPDLTPEDLACCRIAQDDVRSFVISDDETGEPPQVALINVTAIAPLANGFVSIFECDFDRDDLGRTNTSVLNFSAGITSGNTAVIEPPDRSSENSELCVYASAETHLTIDVVASG